MQRNITAEETVKAVVPPVTTTRSTTPFATSPLEERVQSASTQALWATRTLDDVVCGEVGQ